MNALTGLILPPTEVRELIAKYTMDPLIGDMWRAVRGFGPLRAISMDVTSRCNLRCVGCYFFSEEMDAHGEADYEDLLAFIRLESMRKTNFVTVLGGEPSLAVPRLRELAKSFKLMVVTNGLRPIPRDGLEDIAIAVSAWGDPETDIRLRGNGHIDIFSRALANYEGDPRVIWYLTLPSVPSPRVEDMVRACARDPHLVGFNFYGDLASMGGQLDHRTGFAVAQRLIDKMIADHPRHIAFTRYLGEVISTGRMGELRWGHEVCASISANHPKNAARVRNGQPYSPHFRAYNPDLNTTRRCCVGEDRDCSTCFDVWAHMSWILLNLERNLATAEEFIHWLSTIYIFYGASRLIDPEGFRATLPRLHDRLHSVRSLPSHES